MILLKIVFQLSERQTFKERERERQISATSRAEPDQNQESGALSRSARGVTGSQALRPSSIAFPTALAGNWMAEEEQFFFKSTPMGWMVVVQAVVLPATPQCYTLRIPFKHSPHPFL